MAPISAITGLGCIFLLVIFITIAWSILLLFTGQAARSWQQPLLLARSRGRPGWQQRPSQAFRCPGSWQQDHHMGEGRWVGGTATCPCWKSTLLTGGLTALSTAGPSAENTITNTTTLLSARHSSVLAASPFLMQSKTNSSPPKDDSPSNCRTQNLSG